MASRVNTGTKAATRQKRQTVTRRFKTGGHRRNVPSLDWKGGHKGGGKKRRHKR